MNPFESTLQKASKAIGGEINSLRSKFKPKQKTKNTQSATQAWSDVQNNTNAKNKQLKEIEDLTK